jgi:hypothetical protein
LGLGSRRPIRWARRAERRLLSALPARATHVEEDNMSPAVNWSEVCGEAEQWAESSGYALSSDW